MDSATIEQTPGLRRNVSWDSRTEYRGSLRILALAAAGIFFLTLYPFWIDLHPYHPGGSPLFLRGGVKTVSPVDAFLNVLLFIPFGFGLAGLLRRRLLSGINAALIALAAGLVVSYSIEFSQFFIPNRDSSWHDVIENSSGSLLGCLFFLAAGAGVLRVIQRTEAAVEAIVGTRTLVLVALVYLAIWFAWSVRLQKATSLSGWRDDSMLLVGSPSHPGGAAWTGQVSTLEFWNHAVPPSPAVAVTLSGTTSAPSASSVASYDFAGSAPFRDQRRLLPDLISSSAAQNPATNAAPVWNGASWLETQGPTSSLIDSVRKSGRFSLRFRCTPARVDHVDAEIVSLAAPDGETELEIRQESLALSFWFRTAVSAPPYKLEWSVPRVFQPGQTRDFLFTYDGSQLSLFAQGKFLYGGFRLGPGTALAERVRSNVRIEEMRGYRYIFYAFVFAPAGWLLGLAWRKIRPSAPGSAALFLCGIALPAVLLGLILVRVGRQPFSLGDVFLAVVMALSGWVWINLEGPPANPPAAEAR